MKLQQYNKKTKIVHEICIKDWFTYGSNFNFIAL